MKFKTILLFICLLITFTAFALEDKVKNKIAVFDSVTIYEDYVIITTNWSIGKTTLDNPDEVKDWKKFELYRVGDIVRAKTDQSNEYWAILEIKSDRIKIHYYGYLKGVGKFDETFWVLEYPGDAKKEVGNSAETQDI